MNVEVDWIIKSQSQQHANKLKSQRHLIWKTVEPVVDTFVFWNEHVKVRIENRFSYQWKVLVFDSTFICSFLSDKLNS